jgi:hypothetical protein
MQAAKIAMLSKQFFVAKHAGRSSWQYSILIKAERRV